MKPVSEMWTSRPGVIVRAVVILAVGGYATARYGKFLDHFYPLKDWLAWRILLLWLNGALFTAACLSAGHLTLLRIFRVGDRPLLETLVFSMAIGVIEFTMGMYVGGAAHLFHPVFAYALPLGMIAAGARDAVTRGRQEIEAWRAPPARTSSWLDRAIGTLAAFTGIYCLVFVYLETLTPDAINYDSSWCHMTVAESYARHGKLVPFPADWQKNVPNLASILYTWAFIVPGQIVATKYMGALQMEFVLFCWTLAGVGAMSSWLTEGKAGRGAWASFFLFPAIFVYDANMGGAADHVLAFFGPPIFLSGVLVIRAFDRRVAALFGALMGGALLTKYQASYLGGAMTLVLAWGVVEKVAPTVVARFRKADAPGERIPWRTMGIAFLVMGGAFLFAASPHFLKNAVFYGNPVYPFLQDKIPTSHPTYPAAPFLFEYVLKEYNFRPHGTLFENLKSSLQLFFTFSFEPHYSFTKGVPSFGSLFTLSLLFLPFLGASRRVWMGVLVCFGCIMSWAMTFRVDRNLQVMAPLIAATTCAILVRAWEMGPIARVGVVPLVVLQIGWGADNIFYSGHDRLRSAVDLIRAGFDGKRDERFEYRKEFREVQKVIPKDAIAILHNSHVSLGVDRDLLLDWPGFQSLVTYDDIGGPRALFEYWRRLGVSFVLHQPDGRVAASKQHDVLWAEMKRYIPSKRVGAFDVLTLGAPPPVDPRDYTVLSVGHGGYADGLYPLTQMKTHELVPDHLKRYPAPVRPFPAAAEVEATMAGVDAVVAWASPPHLGMINSVLARDFVLGMTQGPYTIHLRKTARQN